MQLKRLYLDERFSLRRRGLLPATSKEGTLTGGDWINQTAYRAVNQAIGRVRSIATLPIIHFSTRLQVIRHRFDWGAILLADTRFASAAKSLSYWLRKRCQVQEKFGPAIAGLVRFYKDIVVREEARLAAKTRQELGASLIDRARLS